MEDLYNNSRLLLDSKADLEGYASWQSPSNLAIVKYWGKYGNQLPQNPSLSMSLEKAYTRTVVNYTTTKTTGGIEIQFYFNGSRQIDFEKKIKTWLHSILNIFPFLNQVRLKIESTNSFPHSAGIASSASAMSALSLCLCSMENQLFKTLEKSEDFKKKASYIARLGSGSACRSIYGKWVSWGEHEQMSGFSNYYASPLSAVHSIFRTMRNSIIIVSRKKKQVSSSAGHALMQNNPYAPIRFAQANSRFKQLISVLETGDMDLFGRIAEEEAMTLHALMMCSSPYYLLLDSKSIQLIELVKSYRNSTRIPVYFSFDAGPNMHLLYPEEVKEEVLDFIDQKITKLLVSNEDIIHDCLGSGPIET